jgi:hypothetical protein
MYHAFIDEKIRRVLTIIMFLDERSIMGGNCRQISYGQYWLVGPCTSHTPITPFPSDSNQGSRLKPSYEFQFEGLSNFKPSVEGLVQIQNVNPRI